MSRTLKWGVAALPALVLIAFAVTYPFLSRISEVGAGYVAMQMCGCVEVSGRPFEACLLDMRPEMERIGAERVEEGGRSGVRATIPIYAERTAWHRPPDACTLE